MLRQAALALALWATPACAGGPQFSDYPAAIYAGEVAKPILDTEDKRLYRTRINEAAKGRPDFAGHFIFVKWGCGASCVSGAVIDARSGIVTMVPWMVCCSSNWDVEPVVYQADSRLIVFNGLINEEAPDGAHYYQFEGKEFRPVATQAFN